MSHQVEKLENPIRVGELNPAATLLRLGLADDDAVCDIGAGTGIFSVAAAKLTVNTIYAVDVNETLLQNLADKVRAQNLSKIKIISSVDFNYPIPAAGVNLVLLATVLHEIDQKSSLFCEINRILKLNGTLAVIEFKKEPTPYGPPLSERLGEEETCAVCRQYGFVEKQRFLLGDNLYAMAFAKAGA